MLAKRLKDFAERHQQRVLRDSTRTDGIYVERAGKKYISFSCNDYLGLSQHPKVIEAAIEATKAYGVGAGASRLITGNHPLYAQLEKTIAHKKKTEAALVLGSGYLTNLGVIPALVGKGDLIIADKLVHACIIDGAQLSGATLKRFKHNDMEDLARLLASRSDYENCLIVTDHVFSMDGDIAPLKAMRALADKHDAWLMADDAHGLGIITPEAEPHIWMGTLSKAAGSYGGYIAASQKVIDYLITSARSFIFSTGLPPATLAAANEALKLMTPELATKALANAKRFNPNAQTTIVPVILGDEIAALEKSKQLEAAGLLVQAIRPPTVPAGTARLRVAFSALHSEAMVDDLLKAL
ncbi:MAG: aminotransferase class I/II-fold pyridoxal phosphate-dependent enzyme [Rickettsiales bacterium]